MVQHNVINLNDTNSRIHLNNVLVESLETPNALEFELNDGGVFQLDKKEFWTAFNVLASDEFDTLTDYINTREKCFREASETYARMVADSKMDANELYEYGHAMKAYGRFAALVESMRERIINLVGWDGWVNACRVYESLTGIQREWLC